MTFSDELLLRYLEKELDRDTVTRIEEAAKHDEQLRDDLIALETSRLPYAAAFESQHPELPDALRNKINTWMNISQHASQNAKTSQAQVEYHAAATNSSEAASKRHNNKTIRQFPFGVGGLLTAAASGAIAASLTLNLIIPTISDSAQKTNMEVWIDRVADYQSLYVRETVAHIKNGRAEAETLLASLAQQYGLPTHIPNLSSLGYRLVRAQQLGFEGEPLIQLVYLSEMNAPLALCFMPANSLNNTETIIGDRSNLATGAWTQAGHQYVIVADESPERMQQLIDQARLEI